MFRLKEEVVTRSGGCRRFGSKPLVSIVVVVLDDRAELSDLIDNLAPFRSDLVELVIVDGGSTDGSLELLEARSDEIDDWLSEPDEGLFDAMNKAIARSRGEFVLHINAGDRLLTVPCDVLQAAAPDTAAVAFPVQNEGEPLATPEYGGQLKRRCTLHHQGTFYRRSRHLGYDTSLRIVADFDHNQRMLLAGLKVKTGEVVVAFHGGGGISSGPKMLTEHFATVQKNFGWWQMVWARLEHMQSYKMAARAREVGPSQVLRSAQRQLLERLRGAFHL